MTFCLSQWYKHVIVVFILYKGNQCIKLKLKLICDVRKWVCSVFDIISSAWLICLYQHVLYIYYCPRKCFAHKSSIHIHQKESGAYLKTNTSHLILPQLCTQASAFRTDRRVRTWSPATLTWTPLSAMTYLEWRQLATALKCTLLQLPHCTAPQSVHCTELKPLHTARWRHPVLRQWCSPDTLTTWWWDTEIQAAIRRHELNAFSIKDYVNC